MKNLYDEKSRILKALAHPSRLIMIDALTKGELCVCELRELVGSDISTVSKHLLVLKNAGIVTDRKEGLNVYYKLIACCLPNFLECIESLIDKKGCQL